MPVPTRIAASRRVALLAFMGSGHSHVEGDYQATVAEGLEFLMRGQSADGHLASEYEPVPAPDVLPLHGVVRAGRGVGDDG